MIEEKNSLSPEPTVSDFFREWGKLLDSKGRKVDKKTSIGRLELKFQYRSKDRLMGRFGAGWNWNLGVQAGGSTVIFNLLVFSIRVSWRSKGER